MRLVAIYIEEHEYLIDEPQTINFGGKYLYNFNKSDDYIYVSRKKNENYLTDFFNITDSKSKLSLISAIVGKNGAGKSSLMNLLRSKFVKNENSLPYSKTILLIENDLDSHPKILQSSFEKVVFEDFKDNGEKYTSPLESYVTSDVQTIYYSPHFDFKYNLNFDEIDDYDISFDKTLEEDLKDLQNKDTSSSGSSYPPNQELVFKNSLRQLLFFSSDLVKKKNIFNTIFDLPEHGLSKLFFRGHKGKKEWNTPRTFRSPLSIIKKKLEKEKDNWSEKKLQINVNKYLLERNLISNILSVIERQMEKSNDYLSYGEISFEKFKEETDKLDAYNSFLWFIKNSKIKFGSNEFDAFHSNSIHELLELLYKYIDEIENEDFIENDSLQTDPLKVLEILVLHKYFLQNLFTYYPKLKGFKKEEALFEKSNKIDGFINYIPIGKTLSSGENALLNLFSRFYTFIEDNLLEKTQSLQHKKHYIILLDEADLGFHPTWKKKFIKSIVSSIPYFFENIKEPPSIQIILTSHDPLTLSDIPKENIVYLNKDENDKMIITDSTIKKSFGANITDLLADSFFVEDGLIGEFAKMKIENTILWLNENRDPVKRSIDFAKEFEFHKKVIAIIDEPIMRIKLSEMLDELVDEKEFQKTMLQKEIDFLIERKNTL